MKKILLIEDNHDIAVALSQALNLVYAVDTVKTGGDGLRRNRAHAYDLIILDLILPDMPGLEVCQELRQTSSQTPVLILTGESGVMDKIRLLDAGADDYLTKPFSLGELKARLRVLERRGRSSQKCRVRLTVGELTLDKNKHSVVRAGVPLQLRRKEFAIIGVHDGTCRYGCHPFHARQLRLAGRRQAVDQYYRCAYQTPAR